MSRSLVETRRPPPAHARPRARVLSRASTSSVVARVERLGNPHAIDDDSIAHDVRYESDVFQCDGRAAYSTFRSSTTTRERRDLRELERAASARAVGPSAYVVRWSASFVPAKTRALYDLALNWPFGELEIEKRDILDKIGETSRFTYRALFRVLARAVREKKMRIPIAKIEGVSELTFDDDGKLTRHVERLTLVREMNAGRVRNKRIARDVLEYLDAWKPPGMSLERWDEIVEDKVDVYGVPGMRQLDVDGLEEDFADGGRVEDATALLGFFTLIVLAFGFGFGSWYLARAHQQLELVRALDAALDA
jgi:hypothetical protein